MGSIPHYITFSTILGICYCLTGILVFNVFPDIALLAGVIIVLTGLLPEIDSNSPPPAREVGSFLAAVTPIMILEFFPGIRNGGVAQLALIIIACYFITRVVIVRFLQKSTTQMGMMHSIPAAIITFEVCYLLFYDLYLNEKLFVAFAAFCGYFGHLLFDASSAFDLMGKVTGNAKKTPSTMKFFSPSSFTNFATYGMILFLGWFVISDIFPALKISAGIQY